MAKLSPFTHFLKSKQVWIVHGFASFLIVNFEDTGITISSL